jgi:hypothetical protein
MRGVGFGLLVGGLIERSNGQEMLRALQQAAPWMALANAFGGKDADQAAAIAESVNRLRLNLAVLLWVTLVGGLLVVFGLLWSWRRHETGHAREPKKAQEQLPASGPKMR